MIIALIIKGALQLLGLASWAEKLFADHQKIEQGKEEQRYDDLKKTVETQKAELEIAASPDDTPDNVVQWLSKPSDR